VLLSDRIALMSSKISGAREERKKMSSLGLMPSELVFFLAPRHPLDMKCCLY